MNQQKLLKMKKKLLVATSLCLIAILCAFGYNNNSANLLFDSNVEALVSGDNYSNDILERVHYEPGTTPEDPQIYISVDFGYWCAETGPYNAQGPKEVCRVIIP